MILVWRTCLQLTLRLCNTRLPSTLVGLFLLIDYSIGTIGHVAHGKSTVVKAISGVQVGDEQVLSNVKTVRFKNELERNITIKLGYANAKIYKCDNPDCPAYVMIEVELIE